MVLSRGWGWGWHWGSHSGDTAAPGAPIPCCPQVPSSSLLSSGASATAMPASVAPTPRASWSAGASTTPRVPTVSAACPSSGTARGPGPPPGPPTSVCVSVLVSRTGHGVGSPRYCRDEGALCIGASGFSSSGPQPKAIQRRLPGLTAATLPSQAWGPCTVTQFLSGDLHAAMLSPGVTRHHQTLVPGHQGSPIHSWPLAAPPGTAVHLVLAHWRPALGQGGDSLFQDMGAAC